ncbi:MAG TPA: YeaH/YhbH family protein [Novosphingobium sp.]|nr:YeaH/YhbH family protein [Novosphingobium sp.]
MHIIDRRLNPRGKSLVNRQRFLRRARDMVRGAVRDSLASRKIREVESEGEVSIKPGGVHEPTLRRDSRSGDRDHILPGNRVFRAGDRIKRPESGEGSGREAGQGEGEDEFRFVLTREEFLDLFLEDLELPELAKRRLTGSDAFDVRRAGYTVSGSPSALSVPRTMRNAMSRRLAMRRPSTAEIEEVEKEISGLEAKSRRSDDDSRHLAALREKLDTLLRRRALIGYVDPIDLRYRRFEQEPRPISQAVIFCLMDVSGSMNEHMKELAKIFFILLYLFVTRCYRHVDIVFVRHTDSAQEVDEETFFYSTETGGTRVSAALEEMLAIVKKRYSPLDWNIYLAQASDGDNFTRDNPRAVALMRDEILPLVQYAAYLEVSDVPTPSTAASAMGDIRDSNLWQAYGEIGTAGGRFAMRKVHSRKDIYPVFRELFQRRGLARAS